MLGGNPGIGNGNRIQFLQVVDKPISPVFLLYRKEG